MVAVFSNPRRDIEIVKIKVESGFISDLLRPDMVPMLWELVNKLLEQSGQGCLIL